MRICRHGHLHFGGSPNLFSCTEWPRIARYRETISAIPPYCALWGFLVSQHDQFRATPPHPFLSLFPMESMRSGGAIPAHKRGISAMLAQCHMKNGKMRAIPLCDIISQKFCEGILHLRNPNSGPNSGKRTLDTRVLDPNSWFEFSDTVFCSKGRPQEKFTLKKFTSQNSPSKIQPRNREIIFTLHLCRAIWLRYGGILHWAAKSESCSTMS